MNTEMENDIFYDTTVYTGSAGFGLFYFMCAITDENDELLKVIVLLLYQLNWLCIAQIFACPTREVKQVSFLFKYCFTAIIEVYKYKKTAER